MVTNWEETIKMPINEPAPGKRKSQIQVRLQACLMLMHVLINLLIVRLSFFIISFKLCVLSNNIAYITLAVHYSTGAATNTI